MSVPIIKWGSVRKIHNRNTNIYIHKKHENKSVLDGKLTNEIKNLMSHITCLQGKSYCCWYINRWWTRLKDDCSCDCALLERAVPEWKLVVWHHSPEAGSSATLLAPPLASGPLTRSAPFHCSECFAHFRAFLVEWNHSALSGQGILDWMRFKMTTAVTWLVQINGCTKLC